MEKQVSGGVERPRDGGMPDPEVSAMPKRRTFTAEFKLRIVNEAGACKSRGEVGAILRREGLYSSHLAAWRRDREDGALVALGKRRGRKSLRLPLADEVKKLQRENEVLHRRLAQAELIIDVQKKVSALLGIPLKTPDTDESAS
jgi:transposase-like protein